MKTTQQFFGKAALALALAATCGAVHAQAQPKVKVGLMLPSTGTYAALGMARAAYEMVIEAFTKADRETLKLLLSPEIYKSFDLSLTDARAAGRISATTLVAITKADMVQAKLKGTEATIAVDFISEQIQLIRDPEGKIIDGDPSVQHRVEDSWVFARNLASADPNWKLIETDEAA